MSTNARWSTGPILTDLIARVRAASEADECGPEQIRDLLSEALSRDDDWLDKQYQSRDGEPGGSCIRCSGPRIGAVRCW